MWHESCRNSTAESNLLLHISSFAIFLQDCSILSLVFVKSLFFEADRSIFFNSSSQNPNIRSIRHIIRVVQRILTKKVRRRIFLRDLIFTFFAKSTIEQNVIEYENYINWKGPLLGSHFQWEITFGRGRWGQSEVNFFTDKSQFILSKREKLKKKWNSIY